MIVTEIHLNRGRNESIFPSVTADGHPIRRSLHWQNIHHVVPQANAETTAYLERHYGARGGALHWGVDEVGLMVPTANDEIKHHAEYLGATAGRPLKVFEIAEMHNGAHPTDTLVVPYIHTLQTVREVEEMGQESWGLPPEMVAILKNKVSFHHAVDDSAIDAFEVPDYKVTTLGNLERVAKNVLRESEELYRQHDMLREYPRGVVIRAEESDGNYGNLIAHELPDGQIKVTINGKTLGIEKNDKFIPILYRKGTWNRVLHDSRLLLEASNPKGVNPEFVVSRFLDLEDSPGMSLVLNHGHVETLGWNKQIQAPGTTACVGTEKYHTTNPYIKKNLANWQEQTAKDFTEFLKETAGKTETDFESISGLINVDIMLPGRSERKLRKRRGQNQGYYVAECNARFTNYTDAVMAVVGLTQREPTPRQIQTVVWEGITSIDRQPLPEKVSPEAVRETLFDLVETARQDGDPNIAFVRMPDWNEMGIILKGDRKIAQEKVNSAIKKARGGTIFSVPRIGASKS